MVEVGKTSRLLNDALDYRSMRQDMIASNIANADTPFYKPRDIRFEEALQAKADALYHNNHNQLQMAQTDPKHLTPSSQNASTKPTLYFRDGHMARNDGNSVDIDVETTEMAKNSTMFNAIIQAKKKDAAIFRAVIEASQKV